MKGGNRTTTSVKNPNWPEANQLAIYKCSWEVEPGTTRNKFNEWSEQLLNSGSLDLKASVLTTGPHCLHWTSTGPHWLDSKEWPCLQRHPSVAPPHPIKSMQIILVLIPAHASGVWGPILALDVEDHLWHLYNMAQLRPKNLWDHCQSPHKSDNL